MAKHGNRSVSSMCGSGDVVEKLGVAVRAAGCALGRRSPLRAQIELGPEGVGACVRDVGVGFMFAPRYHPAMKVCVHACACATASHATAAAQHVAPVRKALGVRTAFNILGPMLNPAVR